MATQQRYHVIDRIDAGGMAEVFKANSTSLQGFEKLVAIKRILPNLIRNERFVRMFLDEAKVSLHLNHTNCVQVFDLGLADGTYFIVMEFVDGTNLKNIIEQLKAKNGSLSPEECAYIGLEVCKGLAHAHLKMDQQHNHLAIVHRDISPPNILISREGEVKITDFGLAKAKSQVEITDPGIVKGKFGYLSPEAAHGEEVDARTDIFAVGILMWEMLTSERLFLGNTDIETLQQVRKNKVPRLNKYRTDVPPQLESIIRKALATDINERFQTAEDLAVSLAAFLFSYGRPVTAFDIAKRAAGTARQAAKPLTEKDKAVAEAVQDAVNRIVSLEEVDDLDLYMADMYGTMETEGSGEHHNDEDFEDPRLWADFGLDDAPLSVKEAPVGEEAWQERGLDEIMRRRATQPGAAAAPPPGIAANLEDNTAEMENLDQKIAEQHRIQAEMAARQQAALQRQTGRRPAPGDDVPLHQRAPANQNRNGAQKSGSSRSVEIAGPIAEQAEYRPANQKPPADATGEMIIPQTESKGSSIGLYLVLFILLLASVAGGVYFLVM